MEALKQNDGLRQYINEINYISPSLGLNYLRSPLLKYAYPSATVKIVNNIAHALLFCPRFYTQVLHLMNKMNLPPPFDDNSDIIVNFKSNNPFSGQLSESEMESSDEERGDERSNYNFKPPFKRKTAKRLKTGVVGEKAEYIKRKKQKFLDNDYKEKLKQCLKDVIKTDDIFDSRPKASQSVNIEININRNNRLLCETIISDRNENCDEVNSNGFGLIEACNKPKESETCDEKSIYDNREFISAEELKSMQLSRSEWKNYSVLNGYEPGVASCRLYLKNISKQVDCLDLQRIYGKFVNWDIETEKNMFDIRLMKVGRMRGQAFITYHSECVANIALEHTNGIVLHEKPIVVTFARSARPKEII